MTGMMSDKIFIGNQLNLNINYGLWQDHWDVAFSFDLIKKKALLQELAEISLGLGASVVAYLSAFLL